ncbi:MAG: 50S ribosomal protein L19 [Lentisphaerae bacterium]|nr:50S ribosomal protein L19 [Lentisphaerota bacterium]
MSKVIAEIEKAALKADVANVRVGDSVNVHVRILEGDKERVQQFAGTVIARNGRASNASFTVRRISHGVGVERIFPLHSPFVEKVEIESSGAVRRSKLYYLRRRVGKMTRLREREKKTA